MTAAFFASSGVAQASPASNGTAAQQAVLDRVLSAPDPDAAAYALNAADLQLLQLAVDNLQGGGPDVASKTERRPMTAAERAKMPADAIAAAACWSHYWFKSWSDVKYDEGSTWMTLNWCGSGGRITVYSVSGLGGAGRNGFTYDGVNTQGSMNVGWEVRYFVSFNFHIGPIHAQPCMQIRGGATGAWSQRASCNLS